MGLKWRYCVPFMGLWWAMGDSDDIGVHLLVAMMSVVMPFMGILVLFLSLLTRLAEG